MRFLSKLFAMALCCTWVGAGTPSLEDLLRKEYSGTEQLLRDFNAEDKLKFDAHGKPTGKKTPAPWTLAAPIAITTAELKEGKLLLHGPRQLLVFDNRTSLARRIKSDEWVSIEIDTTSGLNQERQLREALTKVFIAKDEPLAPLLPDYWRDYIARVDARNTADEACPQSKLPNPSLPLQPASVTEGKKIRNVEPVYSGIARRYKVDGMVEMRAVIDKSGNISQVCLTMAAGAGLDDTLVEAVRQWKYRPYMVNGQPIDVETIIRTNFHY